MPRNRDRGGLSRRQAAAANGARRKSDDELIRSVLGSDIADHFRDHPLDGSTIISAMPDVSNDPGATREGPEAGRPLSAADPVTDTADWFKGAKSEGGRRSTPEAATQAPAKPPSLATAVQGVMASMAADAMLHGQPEILTGAPGEDYESVLTEIFQPPGS